MYLVSVYPTNRTLVSLPNHYIYPQLFNKSEKVEHIYRYLNNNLAFIFEGNHQSVALKLEIQTYQILTNDDEVCIPSLSSILLAVSNHYDMIISDLYKLQVTLILRSSAAFFEYISSNRPASQKDRS